MFLRRRTGKVRVKQFTSEDGNPVGALMAFDGKLRDSIVAKFEENFRLEGDHIKNGGKISKTSVLTLLGSGGGALGTSAAMSGQLFMATANPATLMAIGNGVGSAVMGAGGIVAQAPFIPVVGALMPVLAPLIAFQAISTIMIMNQFKGIHERLDTIEKSVNRVLQRAEATFVGEVLSAARRVEEIETQFKICNHFTSEMIIRLALLEDKVNPIFERYRFLHDTQKVETRVSLADLRFKQNDAYLAILLSILDIRIDVLRLKLALQENVGYINYASDRLLQKADYYNDVWGSIGATADVVEDVASDLKETVESMNWWKKTMPGFMLGSRKARIEAENKSAGLNEHAERLRKELAPDLDVVKELGATLTASLTKPKPMELIYWRDGHGEHCYYTDDLELLPVS